MTGRSLQGAARYLYPSLTMRAGEEVLGERMAYLPVCLKDGRLATVGQTRTARHVTECHGHARSLFMLCCSPSSPWGAARHGGRQGVLYPRGIDPPAAIMCGCPAGGGQGKSRPLRHARQGWKVVAAYGQGCTGRAVSHCSCGLSGSPDRGQTTRTCP